MSAQEGNLQEGGVRESNAGEGGMEGGVRESSAGEGNMRESNAGEGNMENNAPKGEQRTLTGSVVSDRMDKTVTVLVRRRFPHPVYGKYITRSSKLKAHDEDNEGRIGDIVTVASCRPLSKFKSWRLVEVVKRAPQGGPS